MVLLRLKCVESNMMKLQCPVFPYRLISAIILLLLRSSHVVTQNAGEFSATLFGVISLFSLSLLPVIYQETDGNQVEQLFI